MNPEEIAQRYGDEALARLYDVIFDRSIHDMADWILSFYTPAQIAQWLLQLQEDDDENTNAD